MADRCLPEDAGPGCGDNSDCPAGQVCAHAPGGASACIPGITLEDCSANAREACDIAREIVGGNPSFCAGGIHLECAASGPVCSDCGGEASCDIDDGCDEQDAGPDMGGSCDDGLQRCDDGECHDTETDPDHCGACGLACEAGRVCTDGACGCEEGQTDCGDDGCRDTSSDRDHCGACGAACGAGEVCSSGTCQSSCEAGLTDCGGDCVDTDTDADHCGACGNACDPGDVCADGACGSTCADGTVECGGACVDLATDSGHCGMCGNACASAETCTDGSCVLECGSGLLECGGTCTDVLSDPANCGACATACATGEICAMGTCAIPCAAGETECSGVCRDLETDPANCGACGTACRADQACAGGDCGCATGQTECTGACRDLAADPANCGACGNACAAGQVCSMGVCTLSCGMGLTNCGGACVNTSTSLAHCGGCNMACGPFPGAIASCDGDCDMTCQMGRSDCDRNRANGCEVLHLFDVNNCGACGVVCSFANAATTCNGICGMGACNPGWADCDGLPETGCECRVITVGPPGSPPFSGGTLTDLDQDPTTGAITPSGMVTTTTRDFLWVVNVNESSVSKWDANTQTEVARYRVGLAAGECVGSCCHNDGCNMPSRIVVDGHGDAYSLQRAFSFQGTVTKIAGDIGDCVDRNGNGMIDTSTTATALAYGADECVLWTSNVGPTNAVLRAIAIDRGDASRPDGYVWVGSQNENRVYRLDPADGSILNFVNVGMQQYGMIVTGDGLLWVSDLGVQLRPVNTTTFAVGAIVNVGFSKYGIAADSAGRLWFSECCWGSRVLGYDPSTGQTTLANLRAAQSSGVTVDAMGNVWTSIHEGTTRTAFVRFAGSAFVGGGTIPAGSITYFDGPANPNNDYPTAVGVDRSGAVWHASYTGTSRLVRLVPGTGAVTSYTGPNRTYSYSDFTGSVRRASIPQGSYEQTFDLGCNNPILGNFDITGTFGADTLTSVTMRSAATVGGLAAATPVPVASLPPNGSPYFLPPAFATAGVTPQQQLRVSLVLRAAAGGALPIVDRISFNWVCP